jgi:ribose transport system ATP-binding protein
MELLLSLENVSKSFFGVQVLKNVDFDLYKGEVHALLGENGAGKSTLIKILSGAYKADSGVMTFDGRKIQLNYRPRTAEDLGIVTMYQNFHLIPHLSVAENVALRAFTTKRGAFVDWRAVNKEARAALESIEFAIDPESKVKDLSIAKKQMLEIAIALSKNARVMIMDEPTAALSRKETATLFEIIEQLKRKGIGIIYVSHKLEEIREIGDRVTILRDGQNVGTVKMRDAQLKDIVKMMIGRELPSSQQSTDRVKDRLVLVLKNIRSEHFRAPLALRVQENEVLGITGLIGAGKTELARVMFGAERIDEGEIYLDGWAVRLRGPRDAVKLGIGYLPEDRDSKGLCLNLGVKENLSLAWFAKLGSVFLDRAAENRMVRRVIESIRLKAGSADEQVKYLSGGNKQKVVLGKWLEADCKVLILDEPTIGIDIGARRDIYGLVERFISKAGRGVVFISSDIDEILEIADRIVVMSNYRVVAELKAGEANKQAIMELAMGRMSDRN